MDIKAAKDSLPDMDVKGPGLEHNLLNQWVILGIALFVVAVLLAYHIYDDYRTLTGLEQDRLTTQVRVIDKNMASELGATNLALAGVLKNIPYWRGPAGRLLANRNLKELSDAMPGVRTMSILDAEGTMIASNRDELLGKNFSKRDYFATPRRRLDPERLYVSPPFRTVLGSYVLNFTRVVPGLHGGFAGIVSASLDPEYFNTLLSSVLYAPDMWSSIAHSDGLIFLMTPEHEGQAGKDQAVPGSFFTRHRESGKTENVFTGVVYSNGEKRMMALRTFNPPALHMDKPLIVAVSRGLDVVYEDWRRDAWMQVVFFCALTLISTLGLYLFQRRQKEFNLKTLMAEESLRELSGELDRFFNMSIDLLCIADMEGRFRKLNRGWESMLGYSLAELEGRRFLDYVHPEDIDATLSAMSELSSEKTVLNFVNRYRCKDGSYRWIEWRSVPYQNRLIYAVARDITERKNAAEELREANERLSRDITERKRGEDLLKQSEETMRVMLNAVTETLFLINIDGNVLTLNETTASRLGKTADELQGKCIYDFIPPDVARARKTVIEEVILTGKPARFEDERFGRSIDNSIYPVFDAAGKVTRLAVFAQDITMRKQTEDALKEKEERYRLLFNSGNDAIMVHHPIVEGMPDNFLEVNDIACQRFGYSREELLRLSPADIDDPEDPLDMTAIREKIRRDKHAIFEKVHVTRDGRKMPVEINAKLFDLHGEPTILSVLRDITQRKETEEKVKKLMSELERSNRELEQFAYVASHDLQEPLRKIASFAELLANRYKGQLDKKADTFIEYIVDGASRMRILINDILTYSHVMTRGKEFAETDCGAVISRVLGDLDPAIKKSNAAITCDALPTVMADAVQMEQLFQNLIGNAIKYHGEGPPRVHISAKKEKQEWVFSVRDNGIGIGPEHAERIFVIFQRLHTRAEYSGTGIGLAVCKKVVERLGGRIWVESVPGKGATFYFTITDKGGA